MGTEQADALMNVFLKLYRIYLTSMKSLSWELIPIVAPLKRLLYA